MEEEVPETKHHNNRCTKHNNKMIYKDPATVIDLVLETQIKYGVKLSWYRCDKYHGYHLCKFENKKDC